MKRSALLFSLILAGCGNSSVPGTPPASIECSTEAAVLTIGDGYLQAHCGCDENTAGGPNEVITKVAGESLTCSIGTGDAVVFQYLSPLRRHQIVSTGSPSFVSSPLSDPEADSPIRVHSARFDQTGSYGFQDAFNSGIEGVIEVN